MVKSLRIDVVGAILIVAGRNALEADCSGVASRPIGVELRELMPLRVTR